MPELYIDYGPCDGRAVVIGTDEWPGGSTYASWRALIGDLLVDAFEGREASVITRPGSPGRAFAASRPELLAVRRRPRFPWPGGAYWVGVVDQAPASVLRAIADNDEFSMEELWLTAIPGSELDRADRLVDAEPCADLVAPMTSEEVISLAGDGRKLVWLNPITPLDQIGRAVRLIAARHGWAVHPVDAPDSDSLRHAAL